MKQPVIVQGSVESSMQKSQENKESQCECAEKPTKFLRLPLSGFYKRKKHIRVEI